LASYVTVAIWCAKAASPGAPLGAARAAIGVYTLVALIAIGAVAAIGLRRHQFDVETVPHDFDSPEARHRFLGFSSLLLSSLSAVATIFVALAALFIERCH
jgi:hypothetical protein